MLKWLRKYNSFILVVGGVLLMVAWLLPETIKQFGQHPMGAAPMRVAGSKVSYDTFLASDREYRALNMLLPQMAQYMGIGETPEHWLLLTHEADKGGFLAGKNDGPLYLETMARNTIRMQAMGMPPDQIDAQTKQYTEMLLNTALPRVSEQTRLTEEEIMRGLGRLHGVNRMRSVYMFAPRLSERRLAGAMKETDDAATIDYVFIPPEREMGSIPDPDAAALAAHYEKYKTVKPGEGDRGIGYLLPDRVKVAYLRIDRADIRAAVTPDPVEVRKRFVKLYPSGQLPAGQDERTVMASLESAARDEQTDRVAKATDIAVRAEIEKLTRKLEPDAGGTFKKLPTDWVKPDFETLREVIVQRVKTATGTTIPAPTVEVKAAKWLTRSELAELPGIGGAYIQVGNNAQYFPDLALKVRELGSTDASIQVGVPAMEPVGEATGAKYFFMVLDAKKESSPDSVDDIREKAIEDYKKLAAFEKLEANQAALREVAVATGLDAVAKAGPDGKGDAQVRTSARIDGNGLATGDTAVNTEDFRKAVLAAAAKLDPLADISTGDASARTVVVALPKSLGIAVAKINAVSPLTVERFRQRQGQALQQALRKQIDGNDDPYSLARLEERLKVEYLDGRVKASRDKAEPVKKSDKATG